MTEQNKVNCGKGMIEITCPVCGSNNWKLFKLEPNEEYKEVDIIGGFRVACANGCYVDNLNWVYKDNNSFDIIKDAFQLIEDDSE